MPARWLMSPAETMLLFLADLRARHGSVPRYLLDHGAGEKTLAKLEAHLLDGAGR
jgi:hypothetical protein